MRQLELDELFGIGWVAVAQELAMGGYIELEFDSPFYSMKIHYPNQKRREYRRRWAAKKRGK
jgi:hypothetical protein